MIQPGLLGGAITWHPNSLCLRESMSSIVAKLAIANCVSPKDVGATLIELRGAASVPPQKYCHWTLRAQGPEVGRLASLLGEAADTVGTATLSDLPSPGNWQATQMHLRYGYTKAAATRTCSACLDEGYHSVLHQAPWLQKCFIHGTDLVPVPDRRLHGLPCLPYDTSLAEFLFEEWSSTINRRNWWGQDVNERLFCRRVNEACVDVVRRWLILCGSTDRLGLMFSRAGALSLAEAEILSGISNEHQSREQDMKWRSMAPDLVVRSIQLSRDEAENLHDNELFELDFEFSIFQAWEKIRNDSASEAEDLLKPTSLIRGKLAEGHVCDKSNRDVFRLYGSPRCVGVSRREIWEHRDIYSSHLMTSGMAFMQRAGLPQLHQFIQPIAEAAEGSWGHAILSERMTQSIGSPIGPKTVRQIIDPWMPRFSIEVQEHQLVLRLLSYANKPLPQLQGLSAESTRCREVMSKLMARIEARFEA